MHAPRSLAALVAALLCSLSPAGAQDQSYRLPPKPIQDVLRAPALPVVLVSPARDTVAVATPLRYPPIADLAQPMLRLAGLRIDPRTNGIHHAPAYTTLTLERVSDGAMLPVRLPPSARVTSLRFSPDGKRFALGNATTAGIDLYVGSSATGAVRRVEGVKLNGLFGDPVAWMPDGTHLVARVLDRRGPAPPEPVVPPGPVIQETSGKAGTIVTYEDLLENPHDEDLFAYYSTSRLALVDTAHAAAAAFGERAMYTRVSPAPSGGYLLVERVHRPFSYLFPFERFPRETAVITAGGANVLTLVDRPLQDALREDSVPPGPRNVEWKPNFAATLSWMESVGTGAAGANGDARPGDRILVRDLVAKTAAAEIARTATRAVDLTWFAGDDRALVRENDRRTRLSRISLIDARTPGALTLLGKPLREGDRYNDPGQPVTTLARNGQPVVVHNGDVVYLRGAGYGPDGRRPFLDRYNVSDGTSTRLFRSALDPLDTVLAASDDDGKTLLLQRQSPVLPPNVYVHTASGDRALTHFTDPTPQLQAVQRRVVTYKRPDGIDLSFTLYLPPGYKEGTRLPTFLWAYPAEFNDAGVASQNTNTTQTFQTIGGPSEIYMVLAGYAVLDNASIPILGDDPRTVNDTYLEQLVAGAKAAIDKAVEIGVTDPDRVGVGGHSYGAFMTMNLLAHSRLFRAGIARSGAYNRTLTPFGFQNERRTYWEATDLYTKMSPFSFANKIADPVLMIHGMKDDNTGTFPIQSERMYAALKGNGATARLVMLPAEAHGYLGRESIGDVLAEMVAWLDRFVKNAPPRLVPTKPVADTGT
ncbi:MAG: prolyl oligopeptidase family serine peptidase [Candidatus Velthaea sp.]